MTEKVKNEFEAELVKVFEKTGYLFGYGRQKAKEDGGQGFFLYRLIAHSGVIHTNWVAKEAMKNYLRAKAR